MSRLRIAHGNIYAGNKTPERAISALIATGADSIGFNEAYRVLDKLATRPAYRMHYGTGGRDQRRGALDNPILTRRFRPSLGSFAIQASEEVKPFRVAPDRWITGSMFQHPFGVIAHLNVHPDAAVAGLGPRVARVRQYDQFMRTLDRLLTFVENEVDAIVISGDLNLPESKKTGARTPYEVFSRHGLTWKTEHFDAIAWSHSALTLQHWKVIPAGPTTGADHPFLMADFVEVTA